MEIKYPYLMWIGAEHYPTIEHFCEEAETLGISKRVPNVGVAKALNREGVAVFLCHDEGEHDDCPDCLKPYDCFHCSDDEGVPNGKDRRGHPCPHCKGTLICNGGTGGEVTILMTRASHPPETINYREFKWLVRQPKKFAKRYPLHGDDFKEPCEMCLGNGRIPRGRVFGVFFPSAIELVVDLEGKGLPPVDGIEIVPLRDTASEPRRGCGKRRAGFYAVTKPGEASTDPLEVIAELVEKGVIAPDEPIDVKGDLFRFLCPIDHQGQRFRGVKVWGMDPRAEDEAEAIADAA